MMSSRTLELAAALVLFSLVGCGDDGASSGGGGAGGAGPTPCTADEIADCRVNQKACSLVDGAAECKACDPGQYVLAEDGSCAPLEGTVFSHDFEDFTVGPGEEVLGLCQSWTLGNETELWVNAVELTQDEQSHHSNWTFVPDDKFNGPDGVWTCADRDYDQLSAALAGGVIYAQSTQSVHEVQKFPSGAAVRIPPHARIIGDVHLLNTTANEVTGHASLSLYTLDKSAVEVSLAPFHLTYDTLDIPPHASSRFSGTCDLADNWATAVGGSVALTLYYGLPHTHKLGTRFFLEAVGGPRDGEVLLDVRGFNGEARGTYYEPPVDLSGITGLKFGCEFENPRDEAVHWGFGDQEMCEMLGFIAAPVAFESRISEVVPDGSDGDMPLFTGACGTLMIPWEGKL
ncbi:MAG: hypothetical protein U0271_02720 [Polyangiaceae bacterium]